MISATGVSVMIMEAFRCRKNMLISGREMDYSFKIHAPRT